jgi:hypothetical protein
LHKRVYQLRDKLLKIDKELSGDKTKGEIGENADPTPNTNSGRFASILRNSTYGPTQNHLDAFSLSKKRLETVKQKLESVITELKTLKSDLKNAGAPILEEF